MKLKESDDMRAPLAFLLGKLDFDKEFRNSRQARRAPIRWITAEPKTDNLPYSDVEFVVAPDYQIQRVKVTGFDQSILEFRFDQEKVDPAAGRQAVPIPAAQGRRAGGGRRNSHGGFCPEIRRRRAARSTSRWPPPASEKELRDRYSQQGFLIYSIKPRTAIAGASRAGRLRAGKRSSISRSS